MLAQFLVSVCVFLIAGLYCIRQHRRHRKHLRLLVRKMYASRMFEQMTPFLKAAALFNLEEVTVDKTGVTLRYMNIRDGKRSFLMHDHHFDYLKPREQEAMRSVLETCLPNLSDKHCYRLTRRTVRLVNGQKEHVYRYTISHNYKAAVNRSNMLKEQTRSW